MRERGYATGAGVFGHNGTMKNLRVFWKRSGPVLKATLVFTSMLILFGVAVLGVSCFGTVPGSEAFDSGMTLSRTLFQISAVLNMVMLFVIQARLRREKKM